MLLLMLPALDAVMQNGANAQNAIVAYTAITNGPYGYSADNSGLNIGHTFTIIGTNVQILSLGVYDYGGDGLNASHTVTLFSDNGGTYTPIVGGSVTVPSGTSAPLLNAYRFQALSAPVTLTPGNYAVIAYQMNGGTFSDGYSDSNNGGNNGFNGSGFVFNTGSYYAFLSVPSPNFPSTQSGENYGSASFTYSLGNSTNQVPVGVPTISPTSVTVNSGQTVSLTASDTGTQPINYQWYYGSGLAPIAGATNATILLTNVQASQTAGNAGAYSVSAQNSFGGPVYNASSNQATVTVIPTAALLKIMPLGDSITEGFRGYGGYRAPLYQFLASANFNFTFVGSQSDYSTPWLPYPNHEGIPGSEINSVASGIYSVSGGYTNQWLATYAPDIILLLIGTNDYGNNDDTADATNRLNSLIQEIFTNSPGVKLFVSNLLPRTDNSNTDYAIETTFNPFIPGIVASHAAMGQQVYFVDMHSVLGASDLSDGLHPNQTGYNKMAFKWYTSITNVIPALSNTNLVHIKATATNASLSYVNVPGFEYITQRSTNLPAHNWYSISTNAVQSNGLLQVIDGFGDLSGAPPPAALYRLQLLLF